MLNHVPLGCGTMNVTDVKQAIRCGLRSTPFSKPSKRDTIMANNAITGAITPLAKPCILAQMSEPFCVRIPT